VIIRAVTPADVAAIHEFIVQLANYEDAAGMVKMSASELHDALFGERPRAEALVVDSADGELGFAIWYESFNTWTGKPALHIEDVFVNNAARGKGAGRLIFQHLARLALARGYQRMEWSVLNWNEPAIGFYQKLGAEPLTEWTRYRLSGERLAAMAGAIEEPANG
jgi:GNAT superfamily N-acetyltransferase